jgi:hypothetical protein
MKAEVLFAFLEKHVLGKFSCDVNSLRDVMTPKKKKAADFHHHH